MTHEAIRLDHFGEAIREPAPAVAPKQKKHPDEEALETALVRNLAWATGLDLVFLCRAKQLQRRPDIFAVDADGRLHVFELKKAKAGLKAARQIERYVEAPEKLVNFVEKVRTSGKSFDAGMVDWTHAGALLAGFRAGRRTANMEMDNQEVRAWASRFPDWTGPDPRFTYRAAYTLHRRLGLDGQDLIAEMSLLERQAKVLSASLAGGREGRALNPSMRPVGWLVAPRVTRHAERHLRAAAGPDRRFRSLSLTLAGRPSDWTLVRGVSNLFDGTSPA